MNSTNKKWPGAPQPFVRQTGHAPQIRPVVAQLKTGVAALQARQPVPPPVYRPQQTPKVLQCKSAPVRPSSPSRPQVLPAFHNGPTAFRPLLPVNQKWPSTQTIQRAATLITTPVDDKKEEAKPDAAEILREQRKAAKQALKAARAAARVLQEAAEAKVFAEKKSFYAKNAQQAHAYIQTHSAAEITDLKFSLELFRTYDCKGGGMGGEYMFKPMSRGTILGNSVIHVHWNGTYDRQYGHFKNHTDKTKGGGSLGAIDAAKLDAMNVPARENSIEVQLKKEE